MEEKFLKGDTVDLMNIHSEEYRHSKGFFISSHEWGVNEIIEILNQMRFKQIHNLGKEYKSMKICTCRMVLIEKNFQKSMDNMDNYNMLS